MKDTRRIKWPQDNETTRGRFYPIDRIKKELAKQIELEAGDSKAWDDLLPLFTSDAQLEAHLKANPNDPKRAPGTMVAYRIYSDGSRGHGDREDAGTPFTINSSQRLQEFLNQERPQDRSDTIFLIYKKNSREPLQLSSQSFDILLSHVNAFPEFYNFVKGFGEKTEHIKEESCHGYYSRIRGDAHEKGTTGAAPRYDIEICYLLRHIEMNGRARPNHWSIRTMGLYQKFSSVGLQSYSLIIQPSKILEEHLQAVFEDPQSPPHDYALHWINFHVLCLNSSPSNWRKYIDFLLERIDAIDFKLKFDKIPSGDSDSDDDNPGQWDDPVSYDDLKMLQAFGNDAHRAIHVLELNYEVLEALRQDWVKVGSIVGSIAGGNEVKRSRYLELGDALESHLREQKFFKKSIELLCKRAEIISPMIQNVIALKDSAVMKALAKNSKEEAKQAVEDTKWMKVLTTMAVIYLPASYTAGFFSMNYIAVTREGRSIKVEAKHELWFYAVITISLMILTFGGLWCWEVLCRRAELKAAKAGKLGQGASSKSDEKELLLGPSISWT
ncbi:hypothetical protein BDZ91DRAFT_851151 [Kalaharituber pfeilii]|nr:hypothetical protein BDZ91DRAFT_851151 [Kalaharituber pfeilii]